MLWQFAESAKPQERFMRLALRLLFRKCRELLSDSYKWKNSHGNGLREFFLEVPAGRIAVVWEEGVDTLGGLLRLQRIDAVFRSVALFADG
jgi:hypothetical protein